MDGRLWRRGVGTALIRAGEDSARRLGYADWGHGTIVGIWQDRDHDGPPVTHSEVLDMLVKDL